MASCSPPKKCSKCGEEKPRDAFHKSSKSKDGLQPYCKTCSLAANRARAEELAARSDAELEAARPANKRCADCGEVKPGTEFFVSRTCKDGLTTYCKSCDAARVRARNAKRAARSDGEIEAARPANKRCPGCDEVKPAAEFPMDRTTKGGLFAYCKRCTSRRGAAWQKANPGKKNARVAKRRALKKAQTPDLRPDQLEWIRDLYNLAAKLNTFEEYVQDPWQIDHIIPLAEGGTHEPANLQLVPRSWNCAKHCRHWGRYEDPYPPKVVKKALAFGIEL